MNCFPCLPHIVEGWTTPVFETCLITGDDRTVVLTTLIFVDGISVFSDWFNCLRWRTHRERTSQLRQQCMLIWWIDIAHIQSTRWKLQTSFSNLAQNEALLVWPGPVVRANLIKDERVCVRLSGVRLNPSFIMIWFDEWVGAPAGAMRVWSRGTPRQCRRAQLVLVGHWSTLTGKAVFMFLLDEFHPLFWRACGLHMDSRWTVGWPCGTCRGAGLCAKA